MKDKKKFYFAIIVIVLAFFVGNRFSILYHLEEGDILVRMNYALEKVFNDLASNPFSISLKMVDIEWGILGSVIMLLIFLYNFFGRRNFDIRTD